MTFVNILPSIKAPVGTGIASSRFHGAHLVRLAVEEAMETARITQASSVILFLTPDFVRSMDASLKAAVKTAGCLQIVGAAVRGNFTEEDTGLNRSTAAAMVFGEPFSVGLPQENARIHFILANHGSDLPLWQMPYGSVFGGIVGEPPLGLLWRGGKVLKDTFLDLPIANASGRIGVAQSMTILSQPLPVTALSGNHLLEVGHRPATDYLTSLLPPHINLERLIERNQLFLGILEGGSIKAFLDRRYRFTPIIKADQGGITVGETLQSDQLVFWAWRSPDKAQEECSKMLIRLKEQVKEPKFALAVSCLHRGPYLYQTHDPDLGAFKHHFPNLPLLGFYSHGEIAPLQGVNAFLQYSFVLGVFS